MKDDMIALAYKISETFFGEMTKVENFENMACAWKECGFSNIWSLVKDIPEEHHLLMATILKSQKKQYLSVLQAYSNKKNQYDFGLYKNMHDSFFVPAHYMIRCRQEYERIASLMK